MCALQVPVSTETSPIKRLVYLGKHTFPASRYLFNSLQRKPFKDPLMQMNTYPMRAMYDTLRSAGMTDMWMTPSEHGSFGVTWYATKAR
jgi:hypothetical protein